jgi:Fic family protein
MTTALINSSYLDLYKKKQAISLARHFNKIKELPFNKETFTYSASMSSVYSSMIEGNTIDYDTYLKYSSSGMNTNSKPFKEIEDLISAYDFASKTDLNIDNFLKSHAILSKTLIPDQKYSGKIRDKDVYIFGGGVKVYTGAAPDIVEEEINKLFADISVLKSAEMDINEIFYYASMIHLVFAHIHPFADGNGRAARLIEKWFLSQKSGNRAWFIHSEKLYQTRIHSYYKNINIGSDYLSLNYDLSIPFLLMLPMALTSK